MSESLANLLHTAIQDIKQGNLETGEKHLAQVITAAPGSGYAEKAWIWLAETFEDPDHKRVCFENALKINRESVQAHRGLANLPHYISAYVPRHTQEENLPLVDAEPKRFLFMTDKTKQQLNVADQ